MSKGRSGKTFVEQELEREREQSVLHDAKECRILSKAMRVMVLSVLISGIIFWCTGGAEYLVGESELRKPDGMATEETVSGAESKPTIHACYILHDDGTITNALPGNRIQDDIKIACPLSDVGPDVSGSDGAAVKFEINLEGLAEDAKLVVIEE